MRWRDPGKCVRKILLAGDVSPNTATIGDILDIGVDKIFADVKPLFDSADLSLVQWETPLGADSDRDPIPKSGPNLMCPPDGAEIMKYLGADVALLANNHIGDHGDKVVQKTIQILNGSGIRTVGAGRDLESARCPLVTDFGGFKLAVINAAEHEFGIATRHTPGAAPLDPPEIMAQIRAAREAGCRVLVVLHGGHEYDPYPSPRMVKLFRMFADGGADMVFNCHTHCPEGVEVYHGVPIICSPGNFYFPLLGAIKNPLPTWFLGYLTVVGFDETGAFEMELIPYRFATERVSLLVGNDKANFDRYMATISRPLTDMEELERLFDLWSIRHGFNYIRGAMEQSREAGMDFSDPETVKKFLDLRNTYTCEAHCDMLGTFLRLAERGLIPAEPTLAEEIAILQQGPQLS